MDLLYEHDQHEQQGQQGERQRDGRDLRGCLPTAGQPEHHHGQPGDHHHDGLPKRGQDREQRPERSPRADGCIHGSPFQGEEDEHHRRGDQAHDGQGVLPGVGGQPAGDPAYPDRQAAGGQVHRLPQARGALPGPGGVQQHAEHLLPVELAMAGRVAAQQPQVASFQGCCPGRVPGGHVPSCPGGLAGSARAHAVPPASRTLSRCAATAALARRRSVSAPSSAAPSSVSR